MKTRRIGLVALLILGLSLVPLHSAMAAKRLGLFSTQEELDIWRKRAVSGPYKSAGDASPNSPGDWARIVSNKNTFMANPSENRWNPNWGSGCIPHGDKTLVKVSAQNALRDAAFYALVTDDSKVANAVVNELVAQAKNTNSDFSNTSRFCLTTLIHGTHPYFTIAIQQSKFLMAFDFVKHFATAGQRTTIRKWLRDAADWFYPNMAARYDKRWADRFSGDWTPTASIKPVNDKRPFSNGPQIGVYALHYNNREVELERYMALVGIDQDVGYLKNEAKNWFQGYMISSVHPDGWLGEFERWTADLPDQGWAYGYQVVGGLAAIAEAFARIGDFSLYEFTTTLGVFNTAGKPSGWPGKNLQFVFHTLAKYSDGTFVRYGTDTSSNQTVDYRIRGFNPDSGSKWRSNQDVYGSIVNLFYRDTYLKETYMRKNPGMRPYWANPSDGNRHWMGQEIFPGVLFMFGQLEDKVRPYPLPGGDSEPPRPPQQLRIQ